MPMSKLKTKKPIEKWRVITIALSSVAVVILLIASSTLWVNRYIFDSEQFSKVGVAALTNEQSRQTIADAIVTNAFSAKPLPYRALASPTSNIIQGLLVSETAKSTLTATVNQINLTLTSGDRQPVVIDLTAFKELLSRVAIIGNSNISNNIDTQNVPDNLILLDGTKLPNFHGYSLTTHIVSPLAFVLLCIILAVPYLKWRSVWRKIVILQGIAVVVAGLIMLVLEPFIRPAVLNATSDVLSRAIVTNVYDSFIATYIMQAWFIVICGLVLIIAGPMFTGLRYLRLRYKNRAHKTPRVQ